MSFTSATCQMIACQHSIGSEIWRATTYKSPRELSVGHSNLPCWSALRRLEQAKGEPDSANGTVQLGLDWTETNKEDAESGREREVRCQWWAMIKKRRDTVS